MLIQDHINNTSTDFQLFKVPLSQVQEYLCHLKAIFIDRKFQQFPNQLCKVHSLQILEIEGLEFLEALHEGLGSLTSLTQHGLSRCYSLTTFPEGLETSIFFMKLDWFQV